MEEMEKYYAHLLDSKDARITELEKGLQHLRSILVAQGQWDEGSYADLEVSRLLGEVRP
jgi:hypothetical protein